MITLSSPYRLSLVAITLIIMTASASHSQNAASEKTNTDGFVSIFNGHDLEGWSGDPVYWRVEEGSIIGEVTPETLLERNTFLILEKEPPSDFELKLKYRISERGNSGINYRSERLSDAPFSLSGYQSDIDGRNHYTGQNYEERRRTTLAYLGQRTTIPELEASQKNDSLQKLRQKNAWTPTIVTETLLEGAERTAHINNDDWNEMHIVVKAHILKHYVNGVLMSEVTDLDSTHRSHDGYIGVQVHVGPPMKVEFKNILLKPL